VGVEGEKSAGLARRSLRTNKKGGGEKKPERTKAQRKDPQPVDTENDAEGLYVDRARRLKGNTAKRDKKTKKFLSGKKRAKGGEVQKRTVPPRLRCKASQRKTSGRKGRQLWGGKGEGLV